MENKNIIIATFHCVPNYGAVLQAFCLQEYLKQYTNNVQILNYCPSSLTKEYNSINTYSLGSIVTSFLTLPHFLKKKNAFSKFQKKYLKLTSPICIHRDQIPSYNGYTLVVGSDQIWNPQITQGFESVYFGIWNASKVSKIVSYAASIGKANYTNFEINELRDLLRNVSAISVRESEASNTLKDNVGVEGEVITVLDPTLLAGRSVLMKLVHSVKIKEYLLIYNLTGNPKLYELAEQISRERNLKVIEISGIRRLFSFLSPHKIILDAGPVEFVSLFYYADYVVTDSFHGTAFSIIFHRPFVTVPHKTRGSRIVNLLSKAGLMNRLSDSISDSLCNDNIDWESVDKNITKERIISENFVKDNIL